MRLYFIFCFLALTDAIANRLKKEEGKNLRENLMDFPFRLLDKSIQEEEGGGVEVVGEDDDEALVVSVPGSGLDEDEEEEEDGVRCVEKVMMVEETEWEEVVNCEVSHQERCYPSYVTR